MKDKDDSILIIASQLYLGRECIPEDDDLRIRIAKLIMDAGKKAIESCHHETAYIYLEAATSLLPDDCWKRYYDVSLRLHFLTANSANASCKYDKAETILKKILSEGCCVEDKLPSYELLSQSKLQPLYPLKFFVSTLLVTSIFCLRIITTNISLRSCLQSF